MLLFAFSMIFSVWGVSVGWLSKRLPGVEFRQAQTAISTYFIQEEDNFSLAYPTPVLGKPWSIPMEFPLYQWTTVVVSNVTDLNITKAGRLVSIVCFYLCLPALFLLLNRWNVLPVRRWLVLSMVVSCPFYIFYARAFLIETMALMFALWFWVAFERSVKNRSMGWLFLAIVTGVGVGLVKVTTYMVYLLPSAIWASQRLWEHRRNHQWLKDISWMAAAVALPFISTLWWIRFSDKTKELNPLAEFITSKGLADFNLGTMETRFSPDMWLTKWRMITGEIVAPELLVALGVIALLVGRRRWREITTCVGLFIVPLFVFPALYTYHSYYFVANAVLLMLGLGFVLVALLESGLSRVVVSVVLAGVLVAQGLGYYSSYYQEQSEINPGGNPLTQSLRELTRPDEYLAIAGYDWNSMMPYYARRRAVMFKSYLEDDAQRIDAAFAKLRGGKLGALVIVGALDTRATLIDRATQLGLESKPLYLWRDTAVFLPRNRRAESLAKLDDNRYGDVRYAPGVPMPQTQVANRWVELRNLRAKQRETFRDMSPKPVRFFSTYGPPLGGNENPLGFGAHPETRLVFTLLAGVHTLRAKIWLSPAAYSPDLAWNERSDGIEVSLFALELDGTRRLLKTRLIDPREREEDRGRVPFEMQFNLPQDGEIELYIGPGPLRSLTRDWATLEAIQID